jgi:uncharacterized DUF497 family protein
MKPFRWDTEKDKRLREARGVGFADVLASIAAGGILDDLIHPHPARHPHQRIMIVEIGGYAWIVPYVESETEIYWKTIIPSRKMTRHYLRRA